MNKREKLDYLQRNHMGKWVETRQAIEDELSAKQMPLCVCGRLATGLHESHCRKFQGKVQAETIKCLKHLIKA